MRTHTPGPWVARNKRGKFVNHAWRVHDEAKGICSSVAAPIAADGHVIAFAVCSSKSYEIDLSELESNIRLIAAAPDLLAALIGVVRVADRATAEFDAARAAIAKATEGA